MPRPRQVPRPLLAAPMPAAEPGQQRPALIDGEPVPTPLVPSRSLGRLLALDRLWFKLEASLPAGSWLDRGAALVVAGARGQRGLLALGPDALSPALALQAARAGLPLHLLVSVDAASTPDLGWAVAFGARLTRIACDSAALRHLLPDVAAEAGLHYVDRDDARLRDGLRGAVLEVTRQVDAAVTMTAVSSLLGPEGAWLAAADQKRATIVQGRLSLAAEADDLTREVLVPESLAADGAGLVSLDVGPRDVEAARRLLAREEGLIASRRGAAGLAALIRTRRDRQLAKTKSAVVLLANEIGGSTDGPPLALDESLEGEPVGLDALCADLRRALMLPPG